jgi:hypothetical protein
MSLVTGDGIFDESKSTGASLWLLFLTIPLAVGALATGLTMKLIKRKK